MMALVQIKEHVMTTVEDVYVILDLQAMFVMVCSQIYLFDLQ